MKYQERNSRKNILFLNYKTRHLQMSDIILKHMLEPTKKFFPVFFRYPNDPNVNNIFLKGIQCRDPFTRHLYYTLTHDTLKK